MWFPRYLQKRLSLFIRAIHETIHWIVWRGDGGFLAACYMTASTVFCNRLMSVKPRFHTERPIFQATKELIGQTEDFIEGSLDQPIRLILTGDAAMSLYSQTRSSSPRLRPKETPMLALCGKSSSLIDTGNQRRLLPARSWLLTAACGDSHRYGADAGQCGSQ